MDPISKAPPAAIRSPLGLGGANPAAEHQRSLKNFFELPFRMELTADIRANIDALYQRVYRGAEQDWKAVYNDALSVCWRVAGELDARGSELQQQNLLAAERSERDARGAQGLQAAAEETRRELKRVIERVGREWVDRARRQFEHVLYECTSTAVTTMESQGISQDPPAQGVPLTEQCVTLSVRAEWWQRYVAYVGECCHRWTQATTSGLESGFNSAVLSALAGTATFAQRPYAAPPPAPDTEILLGGRPPPQQKVDVPGVLATGFTRARTLGFAFMGVVMLGAKIGFDNYEVDTPYKPFVTPFTVGLLVFFVGMALWQAIVLQGKEREKGVAAQCQALEAYTRTELQRSLERHRQKLERYVQLSIEQWEQSIDRYFTAVLLPSLDRDMDARAEALRRSKLSAAAVSEELAKVRSQRSALQNTLIELQTRLRDLSVP